MSVPAFIDLEESTQVAEIRDFLRSKGADIPEEGFEGGLVAELIYTIKASQTVWEDEAVSESDLEAVFNSIISLILLIPADQVIDLVAIFCEVVSKANSSDKKSGARIRLLSNLFLGLDERSTMRYTIYLNMVRLGGTTDLLHILSPDLEQIRGWVKNWDISTRQVQELLRSVYDAQTKCNQSEKATKTMIELLGTYTEETASQAREDAHKCIVTCLSNPNTYLMDHLLALKPVKFLEGEPIHDLLTIFVTGKLARYTAFYAAHKEFVNSIGLSHEENLHKMRLLSFMQMCEGKKEIDFATIQNELQLKPAEVEPFIIDVVRTKTVRVRIDQMAKTVIVTSTTHRTFGKQQWQLLRERLSHWHNNLMSIQGNLNTVLHSTG